jgi:hypothetical protein
MTKNWKNLQLEKINYFKLKNYLSLGLNKDVQVTEEEFSSQ